MIKSMIQSVSDTVSDTYDEVTGAVKNVIKTDNVKVHHIHTHTIDLFNTYKLLGKNMDNMSDADWKKTRKVMFKTFNSINEIVEKAIKDIK